MLRKSATTCHSLFGNESIFSSNRSKKSPLKISENFSSASKPNMFAVSMKLNECPIIVILFFREQRVRSTLTSSHWKSQKRDRPTSNLLSIRKKRGEFCRNPHKSFLYNTHAQKDFGRFNMQHFFNGDTSSDSALVPWNIFVGHTRRHWPQYLNSCRH